MVEMDFIIRSPLNRLPDLEKIPDMAQPDGILICPSLFIFLVLLSFFLQTKRQRALKSKTPLSIRNEYTVYKRKKQVVFLEKLIFSDYFPKIRRNIKNALDSEKR